MCCWTVAEHLSRHRRLMGGCCLHSKVGCPACFQSTLDVAPPPTEVCVRCGVIPASEGFGTNSSPLQLVNTCLRHVISVVADQWAALRWPCCNWLASSVTFNVIYCDRALASLSFIVYSNQTFTGIHGRNHMQNFFHGGCCSLGRSTVSEKGILTMSMGSIVIEKGNIIKPSLDPRRFSLLYPLL